MGKVTFCKTKAGNGYKIAVNDTWLYVSEMLLLGVMDDKSKSCLFSAYNKE
jgi:hypothetical protein